MVEGMNTFIRSQLDDGLTGQVVLIRSYAQLLLEQRPHRMRSRSYGPRHHKRRESALVSGM